MRQNSRLNTSKTQSYQGFASFVGVEMSVEEKDTYFKKREVYQLYLTSLVVLIADRSEGVSP